MFQNLMTIFGREKSKSRIADIAQGHKLDTKPKTNKRVQFSQDQDDVHIYECPDDISRSEMFYGEVEYRAMIRDRIRAVKKIHRVYAPLSPHERGFINETEALNRYPVNGIENLFAPHIARRSRRCKQKYFRAVLAEQARQVDSGNCNPDQLSDISPHSSTWAVKRAQQIGSFHRII